MIGILLCKIGIHDSSVIPTWIPSIKAEILTEYKFTAVCNRCNKVKILQHGIWNGKDYDSQIKGKPKWQQETQ